MRRIGRVLTGMVALAVLVALLVGAPLALLTFAGNPLPAHLPGLGEIADTLTRRDDGQLFLRALALLGWAGWATFALSVLVEVPARLLHRAAPRLPGIRAQQRAAATLVGAVVLLVTAGTTTAATAGTVTPPPATAPAVGGSVPAVGGSVPAPVGEAAPRGGVAQARHDGTPGTRAYRVARGDYLGAIADRYLGDFDRYPELAELNRLRDPDLILPGQALRLPPGAHDAGTRPHATGAVRASSGGPAEPGGSASSDKAPGVPSGPFDPEVPSGPFDPDVPSGPFDPETFAPSSPATGDAGTGGRGAAGAADRDAADTSGGHDSRAPLALAVAAVVAAAGVVGGQVAVLLRLRRRRAEPTDPTSRAVEDHDRQQGPD